MSEFKLILRKGIVQSIDSIAQDTEPQLRKVLVQCGADQYYVICTLQVNHCQALMGQAVLVACNGPPMSFLDHPMDALILFTRSYESTKDLAYVQPHEDSMIGNYYNIGYTVPATSLRRNEFLDQLKLLHVRNHTLYFGDHIVSDEGLEATSSMRSGFVK
jgi:hypothetical protein